jgi:hypothetical protein
MANLLQHLNITVQVAAILDSVAYSDGVAGMSNLLQHLNNTVQAAAILDPVAFNDGVAWIVCSKALRYNILAAS